MKPTLNEKKKLSDLVIYLDSLNYISYTIGIKVHPEKISYKRSKVINRNSLNSRIRGSR